MFIIFSPIENIEMTFISSGIRSVPSAENTTTDNVSGVGELSGAISDSDTTITLASTAEFEPTGGTAKLSSVNGDEYITFTAVSGSDLTGCIRGQFGSTAVAHPDTTPINGAFIGVGVSNDQPDVMTSCTSDSGGVMRYEFSNDGVTYSRFPVNGFTVTANIHEFHIAVKGRRYFRVVFENNNTLTTEFFIYTYFGVFGQARAPLNQDITDDADATIVRSISTARQPDGDYVNSKADGAIIDETTPLAATATYTSPWVDSDGWRSIELFIKTDVISGTNGIMVEFSDDINITTPLVVATDLHEFNVNDISRGFKLLRFDVLLDGFRVKYTNGPTIQSEFRLHATMRTNLDAFSFNAGKALTISDFLTEVSFGDIDNFVADSKFGRISNVDIGNPPVDIWNGAAVYTGHPVGFTPEIVRVTSSSGSDTAVGTGARTVRISGLKSSTSTRYESEDITMAGVASALSTNTWWRINRVHVLTAGSTGNNVGNITVRSNVTTANIFAIVPAGFNQSLIAAFTVPAQNKCVVKRLVVNIARSSGSLGSALISFRVREPGGVYRTRYSFDAQTGGPFIDSFASGILINAGSDLLFRVESVSDNNTMVSATVEYVLQRFA